MLRRSTSKSLAAAALCAALLAAAQAPARAQRAEPLPEDLEGVGVTEHPDTRLPLDLELVDEDGRAVRLGDYFREGRPVLLVLGYYRCPMLCSLVLNGVLDSLGEIDWVPGERFEIVTVSIDPTDTPKQAAFKKQTYLESYGRPAAARGWHFLTGRESNVRGLADAVGFHYRYVEDRGEYAHPAAIFVVTPDGRLSRYLYGVRYEPRTLRLSLVEASEGKIGTTLDRFLLYCYHYDPDTGRYSLVAMNLMRLGGGITVVVLAAMLYVFWSRERRRRAATLAGRADPAAGDPGRPAGARS